MKAICIFLFCLVTLFSSCKKEPDTVQVAFIVRENSADAPIYNITFTSDMGGSSTVASNDDHYWTSGEFPLEQGQFVSLKTECTAPLYDLTLYIYVNGQLWKKEEMQNPTSSLEISGNLPAE